MIRKLLFSTFFLASVLIFSQHSQKKVLDKIVELQIRQDEFYDEGLFPTKRSWSLARHSVADNTIFFTAAICGGLRHLQQRRKLEADPRSTKLLEKASSNFSKYKSRNGRVTFNFWQTVPPDLPFPNGNKMLSNPGMRLPDDLYTSVLIARSAPQIDTLQQRLRQELNSYSSRSDRKEVDLFTPLEYQEFQAYEVWFGKNMPQTFDLAVMSNVLYFVFDNQFELNAFDSATIRLVKKMIVNEDYFNRTDEVSLYTSSPAVLLYQLAKMLEIEQGSMFSTVRNQVEKDIRTLLSNEGSELEKMMMATSLLRLGAEVDYTPNQESLMTEIPTYSHFEISPFAITKGKKGLNELLPTVSWECEAYNWMLYLEYLSYRR